MYMKKIKSCIIKLHVYLYQIATLERKNKQRISPTNRAGLPTLSLMSTTALQSAARIELLEDKELALGKINQSNNCVLTRTSLHVHLTESCWWQNQTAPAWVLRPGHCWQGAICDLCARLHVAALGERRLVCASNSGVRFYMCECASPEFSYERMRARAALINTREFPMAANIDRRAPQ
jgi:hypothetical protein